jgi:hypothetical protein
VANAAYVGFPLNRWDLRLAQPSESQPGPEVPDDHCRPIHCPRHDPARPTPNGSPLAGFLAGYRGLTREAYALDLRRFTTWCRARSLPLFAVRRADIESFARELEARGRARATVTRRLCTIAGFYNYADLWIMPIVARFRAECWPWAFDPRGPMPRSGREGPAGPDEPLP